MKKLRKFLTIGVMVLSVIAMSGIVVAPVNAAASTGDLIKMTGNASVYYLASDGKRYVFPNSTTYFSWYTDFSGVVTIPAAELQSYPLGGNVTMRPGTKLVKVTTDPSVYAVEPNGVLRKIQSEAQAAALYGTNWNKRVVDVPDAFFTNYTTGSVLANGATPAGSLVKNAGSANIYYYDGTNYRLISNDAAMSANRFQSSNVLTLTSTITAGGSSITSAEFANTAQKGGSQGTVITGSGLMVSLNSSTAAGTTIIKNQALAELASFNLTAANDGAVTVKTIKLKRIGISSDSSLSNIYLYEGTTKLTDNGSLSNAYVTFSNGNGIITIPAGSTKTITVKADVAGTTGNIGMSINAAADITTTASAVTGAFPLSGNLMSMTEATDLATVTVGTVTFAGTTINAGTMNATVWSAPFNVTNKAVNLKYVSFKQVGSVPTDALQNLSLYVNGVKVGNSTSVTSDSRVNFDLSSAPVKISTGSTTVELRADVVKGSDRTFSFSIQNASDVVLTDTNYNVNVAIASGLNTSSTTTVNAGNVSVASAADFTTTEVVKNATNVTFMKYTMKAFGENVKVNTLRVTPAMTGATTAEGIDDLAIFVNGAQVGSSQTWRSGGTYKDFGTNNLFTIDAGQTVTVEVRGTLNLLASSSATYVKTDLTVLANKIEGVTSYKTSPSSDTAYTGRNLEIKSGSLTVSTNSALASMNVSKNTNVVKVGSYILKAGSSEGVRITNLRVDLTLGSGVTLNNLSNLYISENTTPVMPQSQNNFPTNFTLAANESKTIDVFMDLGEMTDTTGTVQTKLYWTGVTTPSNSSVTTTTGVSGQVMTAATGSLAVPTLVANSPVAKLVAGGATETVATYKFVASNAPVTVSEMKVKITNAALAANGTAVQSVIVGGITAPVVLDGSNYVATVTGLNIVIPAGTQGYNVEVKAVFNPVTSTGQGGAATNKDTKIVLTNYKYLVGNTTTLSGDQSVPSNTMILVAGYPTVVDTTSSSLTTDLTPGGSNEVMRFSVTAANSNINLKQIAATAIYSYTLTSGKVMIYDVDDQTTILNNADQTIGATGVETAYTLDNVYTINAGQTKNFVVKVDNTGTATVGNYFRLDLTSADSVGSGTAWQWNDGTTDSYINGYLVKNLPITGKTFTKK